MFNNSNRFDRLHGGSSGKPSRGIRSKGWKGMVLGAVGGFIVGYSLLGSTPSSSSADGIAPKIASQSWYVPWGNAPDALERAETTGCREGKRTDAGVLFIGFGRQIEGGASSFGAGLVTTERMIDVVTAYADGLQQCSTGEWVLAMMTSNDQLDNTELAKRYGTIWGETANAADERSDTDRVEIAAGIDVEPAWGPYEAARAWADTADATGARLVFGPSADGCPTDVDGPCANGWNTALMADLMWGIDDDVIVMPQVYRLKMAQQWANIERVGIANGLDAEVDAALTQNRACRVTKQRPCLDIGPIAAQAMVTEVFGRQMRFGSDISW
jgi:hypothetical protein